MTMLTTVPAAVAFTIWMRSGMLANRQTRRYRPNRMAIGVRTSTGTARAGR
jgi:hypothetical protein